jgi:hypothetical protein
VSVLVIDFSFLRLENGHYIAGATLDYSVAKHDGGYEYTPYKVASYYIDDDAVNSQKTCFTYLLTQLLNEVPDDVSTIIFRTDSPCAIHRIRFYELLEGLTEVDILIRHMPSLCHKRNILKLLGNDALKRKSTLIGEA